jgi:hypothetical protein
MPSASDHCYVWVSLQVGLGNAMTRKAKQSKVKQSNLHLLLVVRQLEVL